ncbi:hypothetical protein O181_068327 [Austropuccinia psidii MF-1]|uniref:Mitochondrial genome maintenance protein MGM101 n=1 Tax=Austropuccinia psidii MF-1 TaxID=1389203 RepID=A0A9Q3I663_9BASI|nr:hypothetical protein [Austropuccinia psidii MF-1]
MGFGLLRRASCSSRTYSILKASSNSSSTDPFAAFDRLNGKKTKSNPTSSWAKTNSSTSFSLPSTSSSPIDSSVSDPCPSTADQDLQPSPPSINLPEASTPSQNSASISLGDGTVDWSQSFSGLSQQPFNKKASDILMAPINPLDVEIKPDGVIYLPEIKYRRILNKAFGPGGWGLAPRGSSHVTTRNISREYALICLGRLVSLARGEQDYFNGAENIPTATEGCKSNALMRCCKDLGIASELWDPNYIYWWKNKYATVEWVNATGSSSGKKKGIWKKKRQDDWTPKLPS